MSAFSEKASHAFGVINNTMGEEIQYYFVNSDKVQTIDTAIYVPRVEEVSADQKKGRKQTAPAKFIVPVADLPNPRDGATIVLVRTGQKFTIMNRDPKNNGSWELRVTDVGKRETSSNLRSSE